MITKDKLKNLLKENIVSISFTKTDGTDRTMLCTLKNNFLPAATETKESTKKKAENDNVVSVWDLEKNAFRSFRFNALKSYDLIEEGYEL
jgi:hypothetical protein